MRRCASCESDVEVARVRCPACGLGYEGRFGSPRLGRLEAEQQRLAEEIVLAAGNLKEVAAGMEVSYPTLRKRLDALIAALRELRRTDHERAQSLLGEVEAGRMRPEEAARLIREFDGGG